MGSDATPLSNWEYNDLVRYAWATMGISVSPSFPIEVKDRNGELLLRNRKEVVEAFLVGIMYMHIHMMRR